MSGDRRLPMAIVFLGEEQVTGLGTQPQPNDVLELFQTWDRMSLSTYRRFQYTLQRVRNGESYLYGGRYKAQQGGRLAAVSELQRLEEKARGGSC